MLFRPPLSLHILDFLLGFIFLSPIIAICSIPIAFVVGLVLDRKDPLQGSDRWPRWLPFILPFVVLMVLNIGVYIAQVPIVSREDVISISSEISENGDSSYWVLVTSQGPYIYDQSFEVSRDIYESLSIDSIVFVVERRRFFGWDSYLVLEDDAYRYLDD